MMDFCLFLYLFASDVLFLKLLQLSIKQKNANQLEDVSINTELEWTHMCFNDFSLKITNPA